MHTATMGRTQKQDGEGGMDQQDIFYRMVFFLLAITVRLCSRVLGADDAPCGAVMGTRGDPGAPAGAPATGVSVSACGVTMVATSVSETPRRCARAVRERVGASPRARRAASSTGQRT